MQAITFDCCSARAPRKLKRWVASEIDMSDTLRDYFKSKGYAEHVVQGGLRRLVENWEQVVNSIIRGEEQEYYEYLNDMDGRHILEEALTIAPQELVTKFRKRVVDADQRVRMHLEKTNECIWGAEIGRKYGYTRERDWWYFHRPRNIDESWPENNGISE